MTEAQAIVEQILDEHKQIHAAFTSLGKIGSDIEAAASLKSENTREYFVPKSLDDQGRGLSAWKEKLLAIDAGLKAHFHKEETVLTDAFNREGTPELADALEKLLAEHAQINKHIAKLLKDADDVASGGAKIEVWEGTGWGMKVNIERFQTMIAEHAERERELLGRMKAHLSQKK